MLMWLLPLSMDVMLTLNTLDPLSLEMLLSLDTFDLLRQPPL
jgi:hypothetical protein